MSFFSYSQLARYAECPLQYLWDRIEKRKPAFKQSVVPTAQFVGSLFAQVVDLLYREQLYTLPAPVLLATLRGHMLTMADQLSVSMEIPWPPGGKNLAIGLVDEALPSLLPTMANEQLVGVVNRTEYQLEMPLGEDHLTGTIDLFIEHADGSCDLLDGKSGNPRYAKLDQLRLYTLLCMSARQVIPRRVGFWFFRERTVKWKRMSPKVLDKFLIGVRETVSRLKSGYFGANPASHCRSCKYRFECGPGQEYLFSSLKDHGLPTTGNVGEVSL